MNDTSTARRALAASAVIAILVGCGGQSVLRQYQPLTSRSNIPPFLQAHGTGKVQDFKGFGTVFQLTTAGKEKVLHRFTGPPDGANPYASLLDVDGTFYGTTENGGTNNEGTVFAITPSGTESVIHSFGGSGDGSAPLAPLIEVNGVLYGTTSWGGAYARGTVFSITPSGGYTVMHSFRGSNGDGNSPASSLLNVNGTLYGTTQYGGSGSCGQDDIKIDASQYWGCGIVFTITTSGKETVLFNFDGFHGWHPYGNLVNVNGTIFGTTPWSPQGYGHGIIFSITNSGKEKEFYVFQGAPGDGAFPYAGLLNMNGTLYGTTTYGGASDRGALFAISAASSSSERLLYSFGAPRDGAGPYASLVSESGTLYGTTTQGGDGAGRGTVFSTTATGSETVIHRFGSSSEGGARPYGSLIYVNGSLYGTTSTGGN